MRQYSVRNDKTVVSGLQALFHSIWSNRLFFSTVFALVLVAFTSVSAQEETAQVPLSVENVTQWDWFKGLRAPSSDWNEVGFSASSNSDWLQGTTPFGYNEFFIRVNHGTLIGDMQNSYNSIYLRLEFEVESPERAVSLDFSVSHDDGIVGYLNGHEIGRQALPLFGVIRNTTVGVSREWSDLPFAMTLEGESFQNMLVPGRNVLAFSVHNSTVGGTDLVFRHLNPEDFIFTFVPPPPPEFIRGTDCDGRESLDIGDPIHVLRWQFSGYEAPGCVKSCDMDDSGVIDLNDGLYGLRFLFLGQSPFAPPFPASGIDETEDDLSCDSGDIVD